MFPGTEYRSIESVDQDQRSLSQEKQYKTIPGVEYGMMRDLKTTDSKSVESVRRLQRNDNVM